VKSVQVLGVPIILFLQLFLKKTLGIIGVEFYSPDAFTATKFIIDFSTIQTVLNYLLNQKESKH